VVVDLWVGFDDLERNALEIMDMIATTPIDLDDL